MSLESRESPIGRYHSLYRSANREQKGVTAFFGASRHYLDVDLCGSRARTAPMCLLLALLRRDSHEKFQLGIGKNDDDQKLFRRQW